MYVCMGLIDLENIVKIGIKFWSHIPWDSKSVHIAAFLTSYRLPLGGSDWLHMVDSGFRLRYSNNFLFVIHRIAIGYGNTILKKS